MRSALHARGLRFRKSYTIATQNRKVVADVAFPRARLAVLVDGCFWHSCPSHSKPPKTHSDYWSWKLRHNQERDRLVDDELREAGWSVVRIWEHEDAEKVAQRIGSVLASGLPSLLAGTGEAPSE